MSENQIVDSSFTAFEHLEQFLWPEGAVCPHCGTIGHATKFHGEKHRRLDVQEKECRKQFTVKVGTVFEHGRMPLRRMLQAVYLMRSSKKRVSAHQLHGTAPPSNARSGVQPLDLPLPRRLRLLASISQTSNL